MKILRLSALIGLLALPPALAGEAGDLVFAERGPWDLSAAPLVWTLSQQGPEVEGFKPLGQGTITLSQIIDPRMASRSCNWTRRRRASAARSGRSRSRAGIRP